MPGVAGGVREAVHHDVEQRHLFVPPRDIAASVELELIDGRITVPPDATVEIDDVVPLSVPAPWCSATIAAVGVVRTGWASGWGTGGRRPVTEVATSAAWIES